ncbi:hypothetical protein ACM74P_27945 [Pseudomonas aeruginosa]|uniref:hypothetical protein n=1 Tax=Pseudomonas aeruginosa TaxID=287 RepID=UPI001EF52A8F|nr:hypothetical protein [Pseudomonas aeruginosa]
MTRISFLRLLSIVFAIACVSHVQAMSRHHDGAARVWMQGGRLCLGVGADYEVGGFFSGTVQVDENQVGLYAIQVSQQQAPAWVQSRPPGTLGAFVRLRSDTCVEYGQAIGSFDTQVPARRLEPGVYEVMLQAGDQKKRRAWFYKRFCLAGKDGEWSVSGAHRVEGTAEWRCDE